MVNSLNINASINALNIIKKLSNDLISKIAAGEVVERPVSVVKELVENALDSNCTKIIVELEDGGKNLIRITDDGDGISKDDLKLSIENHTTSKNNGLDNINTYGFRGEALASINSIAELILISKKQESQYGYRLLNGVIDLDISIQDKGTIVEVQNLFWKIPVRLKFLQSNSAELSRIVKYIKNVAMSCPNIQFVLYHNRKKLYDYYAVAGVEQRVFDVLGANSDDFYKLDGRTEDDYNISGFISKNYISYRTRDNIYFFVNNRIVKNRTLINVFIKSYRDVMMVGRYPSGVIFLKIPLLEVDVNAHPAKTEVRFVNDKKIENLIIKTIQEKIIFVGIMHNNLKNEVKNEVRNVVKDQVKDQVKGQLQDIVQDNVNINHSLNDKMSDKLDNLLQNRSHDNINYRVKDQMNDQMNDESDSANKNLDMNKFQNRIQDIGCDKVMDKGTDKGKDKGKDIVGDTYKDELGSKVQDEILDKVLNEIKHKNSDQVNDEVTNKEQENIEDTIQVNMEDSSMVLDMNLKKENVTLMNQNINYHGKSQESQRINQQFFKQDDTKNLNNMLRFSFQKQPVQQVLFLNSFRNITSGKFEVTQIEKPLGYAIMQIDDLYILSKNHLNECFIIDMHAAHERILYEGLNRGKLRVINILPALIMVKDSMKIALLKESLDDFYHLGFEIQHKGEGKFILYSIPHFLLHISIAKCIEEVLESLDAVKNLCDEVKRELGCRTAIKKGQKLTIQDMNFLLRDMENTKNITHCNHGRRVYMKLSHSCLKGLFNRTK